MARSMLLHILALEMMHKFRRNRSISYGDLLQFVEAEHNYYIIVLSLNSLPFQYLPFQYSISKLTAAAWTPLHFLIRFSPLCDSCSAKRRLLATNLFVPGTKSQCQVSQCNKRCSKLLIFQAQVETHSYLYMKSESNAGASWKFVH